MQVRRTTRQVNFVTTLKQFQFIFLKINNFVVLFISRLWTLRSKICKILFRTKQLSPVRFYTKISKWFIPRRYVRSGYPVTREVRDQYAPRSQIEINQSQPTYEPRIEPRPQWWEACCCANLTHMLKTLSLLCISGETCGF